jgi:N-acetylglucosaminyl-diphospho-decaprenol L-rhamnosyltransferase
MNRGGGPPAVAMVTHQSLCHLEKNLDANLDVAGHIGAEVVVVDNDSRDGTAELLEREAMNSEALRLRRLPRNRGYAAAVNEAFRAVPGRDVLLVNPDVRLTVAGLAVLETFFHDTPSAGVCAPRLVGADGQVQVSAREFPTAVALLGSLNRSPAFAARIYRRYLSPSFAESPLIVDWVIGAAMLIRRDAYEAVGGWDERYFLYMEDADFCRRCARADWPVFLVPGASFEHGYARDSSAAGTSVLTSEARRRHIRSLVRFFADDPRQVLRL